VYTHHKKIFSKNITYLLLTIKLNLKKINRYATKSIR
jgi:hypothetical protein